MQSDLDPEVPASAIEALRDVSTSTLSTQLLKRGFRQRFLVGLHPLNPNASRFVGTAVTMRFIPAREDLDTLDTLRTRGDANLQWEAIERVTAGDVLIIDSRNDDSAASLGSILATRLMRRGAVAVVTDGAFRDGPDLAAMNFPTFARSMTATSRLSSFHVADLQVPIGCAGVAVYPGDIVVGDGEGVVVIPRNIATSVAEDAYEQEQLERYLYRRIDAGEPLWGVYPANDDTLAAYRSEQEARRP